VTLRILFVTARAFPYVGGVETHTFEVGRRLASRGYEVTVLSTDTSRSLPRSDHVEGVRIIRVPAWPREADLYFAPEIYTVLRQNAWDIVHLQGYHTLVAPVTMLAAIRTRIPFVVTFHSGGHSSAVRSTVRGLQQRALGPLLSRAAMLIGVSEFEAAMFRERLKLPSHRFVVIPNGAQLPSVDPATVRPSGPTVILSVGRLERYKGHQRAIAAMPGVLRARPDAVLRIVGTGPFEGELRAMAGKLGLGDSVEFRSIAPDDRQAMAEVLLQATLVVLLSDYEAHPISVVEALALQRPVLVAYTSGLAELADMGLVRAVPPAASSVETATAILSNLDDPLVPPATTLPTWEGCVDRLTEVYEGVATGGRVPTAAVS
jgi:glycosyltransferase involved in cell wall biosynthesis